ncbi:MAG: UbiA family prenyltransferase [Bacteroidia bacterium]|nr:UbiA family prenyltransferase [Bacteroidia bacterium]
MLLLFFRRIRPGNLLIIALTQICIRYTLIIPFLEINGYVTAVSHFWFSLLALSTLLIAAGGYLINDADDASIDSVNKSRVTGPELQSTLKFYGIMLLLAGVITGFCISFFGNLKTAWGIQLFAAIVLYNYSTQIKKIPLLASLAVSLLTVLAILIVYTTDRAAMQVEEIKKLTLGYSLFAFLMSLSRETIKDIQDAMGDKEAGRKTLPLIAGIFIAKVFSALLILTVVGLLVWIQVIQQQWASKLAFFYVVFLIQLPLLIIAVKVFMDNSPLQYAWSSRLCRLVMLAGVFTMPLFYYIL